MTEVLFYHLQNMSLEKVLPPLLEKTLERGWRVVVQTTSRSAPTRSTRICGPIATKLSCRTRRGGSRTPRTADYADDEAANPNRATVRFLIDNAPLPETPNFMSDWC